MRTQRQRLLVGSGRSRDVALTLQRRAEQTLWFRRLRSQLAGTPELRDGLVEILAFERGSPVRDVEQRVLGAIVGGDEVTPLLQLRRGFLLAARPHERQPQLVVRLAAFRRELHGVLQRRDRVGRLALLQQRLAERQVGTREVGRQLDHLFEVLDLLLRPVSRTGAVGHRQVEQRLHRSGRQPERLLQLLDARLGIGRRQRRAEVRAGFRVRRREANRFTKRRNAFLVLARLNEHQSQVVVGFGVVRANADGGAERRQHVIAGGALPSEHEPEQVLRLVRLRPLGTGRDGLTERGNRRIPVGRRRHRHGNVQPGFELTETLLQIPGAQEDDREIDVGGRHGRRQRHRALQAGAGTGEIAGFPERHAEERVPAGRPGIEPHALAQLGDRLLSRAAVPEGRTEVVAGLRPLGTQDRGPLQMRKGGGQVALLAEDVALQRVRLRMIGIQPEGLGQRAFRRPKITACRRRLRALDRLVCRARCRWSGLPRGGALLLQRGTEREVPLAQLGIDLERAFERRDRAAELAALPQCLSELVVHGRVVAIGLDDATQVLESGREVPLLAQSHAQVEVRGHALGVEREGLPEHLHGLVELAALRERRPEVRVRPRVLRVEGDRLPQRRDALGKVGPIEQRHAEPVVGVGEIGGHLHRVPQPLERAGSVSAFEIGHAEREVDLRIVGGLRERLLQLRHRLRRPASSVPRAHVAAARSS